MKEVLNALNIPIYVAKGFEADDVIGTLSRQAAEQNLEAYIVTGDSDMPSTRRRARPRRSTRRSALWRIPHLRSRGGQGTLWFRP